MSHLVTAFLLTHTATAALTSTSTLAASSAAAEPGVVAAALSTLSLRPSLEHRARYQRMSPLSLNDDTAAQVSYFDQRLRLGADVGVGERVHLRLVADVLDGVVFGDNGSLVGSPVKNRGSIAATRAPNLARVTVGRLDPSGSGLDRDNYGFVLAPADAITVRQIYGEVRLPVGVARFGRMPLGTSRSVLVHDGSRNNRWGVSKSLDTADAFAFGTKLSAVFDVIAGDVPDVDPERGVFGALLVGQTVEQAVQADDDLMQYVGTMWYQAKHEAVLGFDVQRLRAGVIYAHRSGDEFETYIGTVTGYFEVETERLRLALHHVQMFGGTREISEGLALLGSSSGPPGRQTLSAFGGFGEVALKLAPLELSMEVYWASGDEDPRSTTDIDQLTFAEDTNVGLHLFENVVAYQTARSAALGVANLRGVSPPSYPVGEIDTRGGLQNAVVLFPQVLARPWSWLSARAGVMLAWAVVPVVDPIGTILNTDGVSVTDDQVNFAGGKPATYWGTEVDLGVTLTPVPYFAFDVEAAYLIPGPALQDEHGDAVNSLFVTARATIAYD
jgi:hypothetical protein